MSVASIGALESRCIEGGLLPTEAARRWTDFGTGGGLEEADPDRGLGGRLEEVLDEELDVVDNVLQDVRRSNGGTFLHLDRSR